MLNKRIYILLFDVVVPAFETKIDLCYFAGFFRRISCTFQNHIAKIYVNFESNVNSSVLSN